VTAPVYTPEFVERGYNNRAAVPDHPRFLVQYPALSNATREKYRPQRDLRYGPNPCETLDLFVPGGAPRGTFVFIHGGYWRAFTKDDFSFVAGPLVDAGLAVAVLDYDLCPTVSIATIVDECRRALSWIAREGSRHGANPDNVVVGGHSAGGHLAAMMFVTDWAAHGLERTPFVGGLTLSGVHDLAPMLKFSFNADFKLDSAEAERMSPVNFASRSGVPLLMACGADETSEFLRQTQLVWDAWPANRRPVSAPMFIPARHHFNVVLDHTDPESALTRATLALF